LKNLAVSPLMAEPHIGCSSFDGQDAEYQSGSPFGSRGTFDPASQGVLNASAGWKSTTTWRIRKSGSLRQPLCDASHLGGAQPATPEGSMLPTAAVHASPQSTVAAPFDLDPPDHVIVNQISNVAAHCTGADVPEPPHALWEPILSDSHPGEPPVRVSNDAVARTGPPIESDLIMYGKRQVPTGQSSYPSNGSDGAAPSSPNPAQNRPFLAMERQVQGQVQVQVAQRGKGGATGPMLMRNLTPPHPTSDPGTHHRAQISVASRLVQLLTPHSVPPKWPARSIPNLCPYHRPCMPSVDSACAVTGDSLLLTVMSPQSDADAEGECLCIRREAASIHIQSIARAYLARNAIARAYLARNASAVLAVCETVRMSVIPRNMPHMLKPFASAACDETRFQPKTGDLRKPPKASAGGGEMGQSMAMTEFHFQLGPETHAPRASRIRGGGGDTDVPLDTHSDAISRIYQRLTPRRMMVKLSSRSLPTLPSYARSRIMPDQKDTHSVVVEDQPLARMPIQSDKDASAECLTIQREAASSLIQSVVRGHLARTHTRREHTVSRELFPNPTVDFEARVESQKEREAASSLIQSVVRGHLARTHSRRKRTMSKLSKGTLDMLRLMRARLKDRELQLSQARKAQVDLEVQVESQKVQIAFQKVEIDQMRSEAEATAVKAELYESDDLTAILTDRVQQYVQCLPKHRTSDNCLTKDEQCYLLLQQVYGLTVVLVRDTTSRSRVESWLADKATVLVCEQQNLFTKDNDGRDIMSHYGQPVKVIHYDAPPNLGFYRCCLRLFLGSNSAAAMSHTILLDFEDDGDQAFPWDLVPFLSECKQTVPYWLTWWRVKCEHDLMLAEGMGSDDERDRWSTSSVIPPIRLKSTSVWNGRHSEHSYSRFSSKAGHVNAIGVTISDLDKRFIATELKVAGTEGKVSAVQLAVDDMPGKFGKFLEPAVDRRNAMFDDLNTKLDKYLTKVLAKQGRMKLQAKPQAGSHQSYKSATGESLKSPSVTDTSYHYGYGLDGGSYDHWYGDRRPTMGNAYSDDEDDPNTSHRTESRTLGMFSYSGEVDSSNVCANEELQPDELVPDVVDAFTDGYHDGILDGSYDAGYDVGYDQGLEDGALCEETLMDGDDQYDSYPENGDEDPDEAERD